MNNLTKYAQYLYLDGLCAIDFPEQEPAFRVAKWYDLFHLLVPMCGIITFSLAIENRHEKLKEK